MTELKLTKLQVLDFLKKHKLMSIATYGDHPWIATVYYSYDNGMNIYFLSSPETLHAMHIKKNELVAISIADSDQKPADIKRGLQLYGHAQQISDGAKIQHALRLWKETLNISDPLLTYQNMMKKVVKGRMYRITPKMIKLFDQQLFDVDDGQEPVLLV